MTDHGTMVNMLECTWNDSEAETALRRMRLKEQNNRKLAAGQSEDQQETSRVRAGAAGVSNVSLELLRHQRDDLTLLSTQFRPNRLSFSQQLLGLSLSQRSTKPFGSGCSLTAFGLHAAPATRSPDRPFFRRAHRPPGEPRSPSSRIFPHPGAVIPLKADRKLARLRQHREKAALAPLDIRRLVPVMPQAPDEDPVSVEIVILAQLVGGRPKPDVFFLASILNLAQRKI